MTTVVYDRLEKSGELQILFHDERIDSLLRMAFDRLMDERDRELVNDARIDEDE